MKLGVEGDTGPVSRVFVLALAMLLVSPMLLAVPRDDAGIRASPQEPETRELYLLQVTNTLDMNRPNEVVRYTLTFDNFQHLDPSLFQVRSGSTGLEVLSGHLASTVERYPSNFIHRMDIVFQDDFGPLETKAYEIDTGNMTALTGDLTATSSSSAITVRDGPRRYTVYKNDVDRTGVYVEYSNGSAPTVRGYIFVRAGGNQLTLDQASVEMWWGEPTLEEIEVNNVMVSVHLQYENPSMVNWGVGTMADLFKDTDIISGDVYINFYNDREMWETLADKKVNEKFHNHNGFIMEFTVLYAGDAEYQQVFGNSNHQIMTARTREPTWTRINPVFRNYDIGNRSSPALGDIDDDQDYDMVIGSAEGEIRLARNSGNILTPSWTLDTNMFAAFSGIANYSVPWLADIDGDADADLILGKDNGTLVEIENTGSVALPSWSLNYTGFLGIDVGDFSAPTLGDLDNDTDLDLVLGELGGTLSYFENTGNSTSPSWSFDPLEFQAFGSFGNNSIPNLYDLDDDGDLDIAIGLSDGTIINLMNVGNVSAANWSLQPTLFAGIDVGSFAAPSMADLNNDGDADFVSGETEGSLFYYQNLGTPLAPVWWQDSFIHRLSSLGARAVPDFADLDADGDFDLTVGLDNGTLRHFENVGLPTLVSWHETSLFGGIDVGDYSTPALADLDDDGDLDLTIGSLDGTLTYYENTGTNASAIWTLNASMFPGIDVGDNSAPEFVDLDDDGAVDLTVGNASGCVNLYRNTGTVASPSWTYDPVVFSFMNTGLSKKPGNYATPSFADVDGDGDWDFISGQDNAAFGSVVLYLNTGTKSSPVYDQLYPGMFNNVRGGATDGTRDYSAPEWVDLDGDGREDITVGSSDGWLTFYRNLGNSSAQRSVNYMEPQRDGSYRFYYDQDGNDGQFVIRGNSNDFFDYYVLANPTAGRAVMRFIPGFAGLAYRDKYSGDQYPWAGGNVSYYPFIPEEDGYVGRGIVISRAQAGLGMGASFLSQTGTAGGFILVPLTAKSHTSREVLLPQISHETDYSVYDTMAQVLGTPLIVSAPPDLTISEEDITSNPPDPGEGDIITLTANVRNIGHGAASNVEVEFFDGSPTGNNQIGTTQVIPTVPAEGNETAFVTWNLSGTSGPHDVYVRIDESDTIAEMDEGNNLGFRLFNITAWSRMWSPPFRITFDTNNSLEPTMVEDSNGNMWIAYHTYTKHDDWDIAVRSCRNLVCAAENPIVTDAKRTSQPFLVADDSGNVYVIYSSNIVEWWDFVNLKNSIYYWSQKFDLYAMKYNGTDWEPTVQVTQAETRDDSDQVPVATIDGAGNLWVIQRSTHYDLYEGGYQMANLPYNDMNITAASFDGMSWTTDIIVNNEGGSQGFWGGPTTTTDSAGTVWAAWGAEISNTQWDIFATYWTGAAWAPKMQVSTSPLHDMRPSMAADSLGNIYVAWESTRTGDKEIFMRYFDGAWSPEIQVTDHPGHDIKASVVVDMHDDAWIAWETDRHGNKDVYIKRFNGSWSPPIQVTTSGFSDEEPYLAASDSTDSIWIAWETDRHGNKDIYVKTLPDVLVWPDREVGRPYNIMAEMVAPDYSEMNITWDLSKDDGAGENDVVAYDVRCGPAYDKDGTGYFLLTSVPSGTGYYVYTLPPIPQSMFCYVESRDDANNTLATTEQIGLLVKQVVPGSNLISVPFAMRDWSVSRVLGSVDYIDSWMFNGSTRQWMQNTPYKGYADIDDADRTMGIWVNSSINGNLLVAGVVPDSTTIQLRPGWNLIGFPSLRTDYTVGDFMADTGATRVEGYDQVAPPYYLQVLLPGQMMAPGEAYWVNVPANVQWTIGN